MAGQNQPLPSFMYLVDQIDNLSLYIIQRETKYNQEWINQSINSNAIVSRSVMNLSRKLLKIVGQTNASIYRSDMEKYWLTER